MQKSYRNILLFVFALGLLVSLPLLGHITKDSQYYGFKTDLEVPVLPGYDAEAERLRLVFFGYQHCGTVCPLQLMNLKELHKRLMQQPVNFVFVTLDPERDSQQELDQIMSAMGENFYAVRPETQAEAQALAMGFSEYAGKVTAAEGYDFNHGARIYAVTPDNRRHLLYVTPELDLDRVEADIERLLAGLKGRNLK
ncbi:SCO family protein [Marinobacter sp.]|uniref:SCO family protein n=1 Tax=Marinobacter sp. TaxID=50741 RepID=UPI003569A669